MSCENCGSCGTATTPSGCGDKGHCSSGSCNKLNTFDWLSHIDLPEQANIDIIEVGFKNNARKEFYRKPHYLYVTTGDYVVVESAAGSYDIGRVSLVGELVRMQMKKKRVRDNAILPNVLRLANERDTERLSEARALETETLVKARAIARSLNLDMKVGDVEFQGDKRKVTFYYTADGRIDFRELIRIYAKEFKVKIEMRQIGARQESARIGGIGACGRELCCSTWLSDFKSVSTVAARYQNLAINQSKLSGQCGRLKCCLNYELKSYLDALRDFPKNVDKLETQRGPVILIKTDIFKKLMYYGYQQQYGVADIQPLTTDQVKQFAEWNAKGIKPADLAALQPNEAGEILMPIEQDPAQMNKQQRVSRLHRKLDKTDGAVEEDEPLELPDIQEKSSKRRKNKKRKPGQGEDKQPNNNQAKGGANQDFKPSISEKPVMANNPTKENQPKGGPQQHQKNKNKQQQNAGNPNAPKPQHNNQKQKANAEGNAIPASEKTVQNPNQQAKAPAGERPEKAPRQPQQGQHPNQKNNPQQQGKKPVQNPNKPTAAPQNNNQPTANNNQPVAPANTAPSGENNPNNNPNANPKNNKFRFHHHKKGKNNNNQNKPNEKNNQPPKQ